MTKKLIAAAQSPRSARRWEQRRNSVAVAFLGVVLAALLASSALQPPAVAAASSGGSPILAPLPSHPEIAPLAEVIAPSNPAPAGAALLVDPDVENLSSVVARRYRVSRDATRSLVGAAYRAGRRSGVDPLLVVAVIAVESRFNPIAQSDGGAMGLMQIIPRYHANKLDDKSGSVLDPETNIELGVTVLKDYIKRGGTEIAGLQLYNGALGDPENGYATRVLAEKQRLQEALRREREHDRV